MSEQSGLEAYYHISTSSWQFVAKDFFAHRSCRFWHQDLSRSIKALRWDVLPKKQMKLELVCSEHL
jgi:hypothetical protein